MTHGDELSTWLSARAEVHAVMDRTTRMAGVRTVGIRVGPILSDVGALFGSSTGTFLTLGWGASVRLETRNGVVSRALHLKGSPLDPFGALPPALRGRLRGIIGFSPAAFLAHDRRIRRLPGPAPELFAGADGLALPRRLIGEGRDWLSGRGRLRFGVAADQADAVRAMIGDAPHRAIPDRRGRTVSFVLGPRA